MSGGQASHDLILASASGSRRSILKQAGLMFRQQAANVDEGEVKDSFRAEGAPAAAAADALAELKAKYVSRQEPSALVIGADQMLVCNGTWFDKPPSIADARDQLRELRGQTHELIAAAVVVQAGTRIWQHCDSARLTMRPFSDAYLESYLAEVGDAACQSVGAYQVEGIGIQLFSRIAGDHFTIRGLPLLPLLDFLRNHGVVGE